MQRGRAIRMVSAVGIQSCRFSNLVWILNLVVTPFRLMLLPLTSAAVMDECLDSDSDLSSLSSGVSDTDCVALIDQSSTVGEDFPSDAPNAYVLSRSTRTLIWLLVAQLRFKSSGKPHRQDFSRGVSYWGNNHHSLCTFSGNSQYQSTPLSSIQWLFRKAFTILLNPILQSPPQNAIPMSISRVLPRLTDGLCEAALQLRFNYQFEAADRLEHLVAKVLSFDRSSVTGIDCVIRVLLSLSNTEGLIEDSLMKGLSEMFDETFPRRWARHDGDADSQDVFNVRSLNGCMAKTAMPDPLVDMMTRCTLLPSNIGTLFGFGVSCKGDQSMKPLLGAVSHNVNLARKETPNLFFELSELPRRPKAVGEGVLWGSLSVEEPVIDIGNQERNKATSVVPHNDGVHSIVPSSNEPGAVPSLRKSSMMNSSWDRLRQFDVCRGGVNEEDPWPMYLTREVGAMTYGRSINDVTLSQMKQCPIVIAEHLVVRDSLSALCGVPSFVFPLAPSTADSDRIQMRVRENICLPACGYVALHTALTPICDIGTRARYLEIVATRLSMNELSKGKVSQAFGVSLLNLLSSCRNSIFSSSQTLGSSHGLQSIIDLKVSTTLIARKIEYLSDLCSFGAWREGGARRQDIRINNNYTGLNKIIDTLPSGSALLSHLYHLLLQVPLLNETLRTSGRASGPGDLLFYLFRRSLDPYVAMIQSWAFSGHFSDPHLEFVVKILSSDAAGACIPQSDADDYWANSFKMRPVIVNGTASENIDVPVFLTSIASSLFSCGKTLNLLRLASPSLANLCLDVPRVQLILQEIVVDPFLSDSIDNALLGLNVGRFMVLKDETSTNVANIAYELSTVHAAIISQLQGNSAQVKQRAEDRQRQRAVALATKQRLRQQLKENRRRSKQLRYQAWFSRKALRAAKKESKARKLRTETAMNTLETKIGNDVQTIPDKGNTEHSEPLDDDSESESDFIDESDDESSDGESADANKKLFPLCDDGVEEDMVTAIISKMSDNVELLCGDESSGLPQLIDKHISSLIRAQCRFVNSVAMYLFIGLPERSTTGLEGVRVDLHFAALRRYLLMDAGDFTDQLTSMICSSLEQQSISIHAPTPWCDSACLAQTLSTALKSSFRDADPLSSRLSLVWKPSVESENRFPFINVLPPNPHCIEALDSLRLQYHVSWPLNIILTQTVLEKYQQIWSFLMRQKRVSYVLRHIWIHFNFITGSSGRRGQHSNDARSQLWSSRFRHVQMFRFETQQFVNVMFGSLITQVLEGVWTDFQNMVHNGTITDIDKLRGMLQEMRYAHSAYLEAALNRCMLSDRAAPVRAVVNSIFSLILKFRFQLDTIPLNAGLDDDDDNSGGLLSNVVYADMMKTWKSFRKHTHFLWVVLTKQLSKAKEIGGDHGDSNAMGNLSYLNDLLVRLNFNHHFDQFPSSESGDLF